MCIRDRAYLTYRPAKWATVTGGRIANPFESTDMLFSNDLNFDGIAAIFKQPLEGRDVTLFGTLGAFSTEYGSNGWNSSSFSEGKSEDKWLLAAQAGADWKIDNRNSVRGALAYYCLLYTSQDYRQESELHLVNWLRAHHGYDGGEDGARAALDALASEQQGIYARQLYFAELRKGGREYNDQDGPRSGSYLRGRRAIAAPVSYTHLDVYKRQT